MDLSIVIINFKTEKITLNCIKSLKSNLKAIRWELIIVDNGAVINNEELFVKENFETIYIRSKENIGFGPANNLGIERATGKYILLLNSDTLVFDNSIERCYRFMETEEGQRIGLLGCKLLNEDRTFQPSFFPFLKNSIFNYLKGNNLVLFRFFRISEKYSQRDELRQVGDVSGAFMFLRSEVIKKVGGFDPDFFLYCEETEWCRERIAKHFKIFYYPQAAIIHFGGQSAPQDMMYIQSKLSEALLWYKKGWAIYIIFVIICYLNLLSNLFFYPVVKRKAKSRIKKDLEAGLKIAPYLFKDVVSFGRHLGAREEPLVLKEAKPIFFGKP